MDADNHDNLTNDRCKHNLSKKCIASDIMNTNKCNECPITRELLSKAIDEVLEVWKEEK